MKEKYIPLQERVLSFITVEPKTFKEIYLYFEEKIDENVLKYALQTLQNRKLLKKELQRDGKTEVFFI